MSIVWRACPAVSTAESVQRSRLALGLCAACSLQSWMWPDRHVGWPTALCSVGHSKRPAAWAEYDN